MSFWSDLKTSVAAVIKPNGTQAINGGNHQATLLDVIDKLGENYSYKGLATTTTDPGTPDGVVYYMTTQNGTYYHFLDAATNPIIVPINKLAIIKGSGDIWSVDLFDVATGTLPAGTLLGTILRWDGSDWVETPKVLIDGGNPIENGVRLLDGSLDILVQHHSGITLRNQETGNVSVSVSSSDIKLSAIGLMPADYTELIVDTNGITAPNYSISKITDDKSLVTKEYLEQSGAIAAEDVSLADTEDFYNSDNVEDALAEIRQGDQDANERSGFVTRTTSEISFVDATRTFTIQPKSPATSFDFYSDSKKITKSAAESVVLSDDDGIHLVYYNNSVLTGIFAPTEAIVSGIIRTKAIVSLIYWNSTKIEAIRVHDERHGMQMDGSTHMWLHQFIGAQWAGGFGLGDILADENGNLDSHAQFSVASGSFSDEDLYHRISALGSTAGIRIYYKEGAAGIWNESFVAGQYVMPGAGSLMAINEWSGTVWEQKTLASGNYGLMHVFATPDIDNPIMAVQGEVEYSTLSNAREGALTEINALVLDKTLSAESVAVATVIFETKSTFTNSVKAKIVSTDDGDYIDWRTTEFKQGASATSHAQLADLSSSGHPASIIAADTTNFGNNLSSADDTVQKALDTVDDLALITLDTNSQQTVATVWVGTQAQYDAITTPSSTVIYYIT